VQRGVLAIVILVASAVAGAIAWRSGSWWPRRS